MNKPVIDAHCEFLALVRNPIDRFRAAWAYEHPRNAPFRKYPNHRTAADLERRMAFFIGATMPLMILQETDWAVRPGRIRVPFWHETV